ncbi:MAG TPA: trans-aconitate 2-methyltransferase [Jiangellaceae bacterium]|nr:trans-aconitate 2-methyltransferase [Jiangellaceae bacterium]
MVALRWNPDVYSRFAALRARPFIDLVSAVHAQRPRTVVDVGCGTAELTATLLDRWPSASVTGIDSSAEMLAQAPTPAGPDTHLASDADSDVAARFHVEQRDVREFTADGVDVVISNSTLQWVPEHRDLLRRWAGELPDGAWLAVQVPGNFTAPSHEIMRALAGSSRWASRLEGVLRGADSVGQPVDYAELLLTAGLEVDAWETTYLQLLTGEDPVLDWVRGTALRPVLEALTPEESSAFETEYAALLREAYPAGAHGTHFPFRRIFVVAHKPSRLRPREPRR